MALSGGDLVRIEGQAAGQFAVGVSLGEEVVGLSLERGDRVGAGRESQRRLLLTCQVDQRVGELRGIAALLSVHGLPAGDRLLGPLGVVLDRGCGVLGRLRREQLRAEEARLDQHRADSEPSNLRGQRLHPTLDPELRRGVSTCELAALEASRGGDRDHQAGALGAHHREGLAGHVDRAEQRGLDLGPELLRAQLLEEAGVEVACVVDQHIDPAEPVDRSRHGRLSVGRVGDVQLDRQEVATLSDRRADPLRVPSGGGHRVTSRQRGLGDVDAQTATSSGHQPNLLVAHAAAHPFGWSPVDLADRLDYARTAWSLCTPTQPTRRPRNHSHPSLAGTLAGSAPTTTSVATRWTQRPPPPSGRNGSPISSRSRTRFQLCLMSGQGRYSVGTAGPTPNSQIGSPRDSARREQMGPREPPGQPADVQSGARSQRRSEAWGRASDRPEGFDVTSQKQLKARVRTRMAATGERYAAARARLVGTGGDHDDLRSVVDSGWTLRGGSNPDSAALANVLANSGVIGPEGPLSEELIFLVAGGLGAGYILWEFQRDAGRIVTLGFTHLAQYFDRRLSAAISRLGVQPDWLRTSGAVGAAAELRRELAAGQPVIVWPDRYLIGYWQLPAFDGLGGHPVIAYAERDGRIHLDDRTLAPLTVAGEDVDRARARVGSYRNAMLAVRTRDTAIPEDGC